MATTEESESEGAMVRVGVFDRDNRTEAGRDGRGIRGRLSLPVSGGASTSLSRSMNLVLYKVSPRVAVVLRGTEHGGGSVLYKHHVSRGTFFPTGIKIVGLRVGTPPRRALYSIRLV